MALATIALLTASCTGSIFGGEDDDDDEVDESVEPPAADSYESAPPPPDLSSDKLAALDAAIAGILNGGETHTLKIRNLTTGQDIAGSNTDLALKPASNMKLFTSAAALEVLGSDHRVATRVFASAPISADGTLDGDLWIIGDHDFSLSTYYYEGDRTPLDRLAAQLYGLGLRTVSGSLHVSGEFVYAGNSLGTLNVAAERESVAAQMSTALLSAGIESPAPLIGPELEAPSGTSLLLQHDPLPLAAAISPLNTVSHNEFADLLVRHFGSEMKGESSFAGGAAAILDWLGSFSAPVAGVAFFDGSGLSHSNRVSADAIIALLEFMDTQPTGHAWRHSLAIAGIRGTIGNRITGADTRGRVHAKTGTLSDTISLSGYLDNRFDGQRYAFSVLLNNVSNKSSSRARCDQVVERIAENLHDIDERLEAPTIHYLRALGWDGLAEVSWEPVEGAASYLIWFSDDGTSWDRRDARLVTKTRFVADGLSSERPTYVRVSALAADGFESNGSVVFATHASSEPSPILLVDANERWFSEPAAENTLRGHHNFLVPLANTELPHAMDSVSNQALVAGELDINDYALVLWATGEESTSDDALSLEEQSLLTGYLDGGGALLLSGAELVWALDQRNAGHDQSFLADVLHASYVADDAETFELEGSELSGFSEVGVSSFYAPDSLDVQFPDVLRAEDGADALLQYTGGLGGTAAVGSSDVRRVIVTGFPLEALAAPGDRRAILDACYQYLGL